MKRGDKKGQFYLVAAMIIIIIVSSIVSISNYSIERDLGKDIEKIGEELEIEIYKVLDYDNANNQDMMEDFTEKYSKYVGEETEIIFIYVGETNEAYTYEDDLRIELNSGLSVVEEEVIFNYGNKDYQFNLNRGNNFYFIISKEVGNEKYVYKN
jgi:hypothetical protein